MRIVRVGKRRHIIGLWWQLADGSNDLRKQANEANAAINGLCTRCVLLKRQIALGEGKALRGSLG
ncbi:MAG: hypothetical protein J5861_07785, partial [Desulfovibrio sp.]|nr:hypothetical protein [Desulfovibrio sp.]